MSVMKVYKQVRRYESGAVDIWWRGQCACGWRKPGWDWAPLLEAAVLHVDRTHRRPPTKTLGEDMVFSLSSYRYTEGPEMCWPEKFQ